MATYFLSDLHITSMQDANAQKFLTFLKERKTSNTQNIFLLGDVFDLWISNHHYFVNQYQPIVEELRRIVNEGMDVHYFEGNHDLYLRKYWQREVGTRVHTGYFHVQIGNFNIRMEHGDLSNPEDKGYLFLRWVLRTTPLKILAHSLPGKLVGWIGESASEQSRDYTASLRWDSKIKVREYAEFLSRSDDFDVIITGHTHQQDDFEFITTSGKTVRSINLGSWYDGAKALKITKSKIEFISLE